MSRRSRADLAGVVLGESAPVAIMGVINVSPESFHAGSVYRGDDAVLAAALDMVEAGAALIDVGGRASAPYRETAISEADETRRLVRAVGTLAAKLPVPVSADTSRPAVARAALEAGARVRSPKHPRRPNARTRAGTALGARRTISRGPSVRATTLGGGWYRETCRVDLAPISPASRSATACPSPSWA